MNAIIFKEVIPMNTRKEVDEWVNNLNTLSRALDIERYTHFWHTKENEAYIIGFDAFLYDYKQSINSGIANKDNIERAIKKGIEKNWIKKSINRKCFTKGYKKAGSVLKDEDSKKKYELLCELGKQLESHEHPNHLKSAIFLLMDYKDSTKRILTWLNKNNTMDSFDIVRNALMIVLGGYKKYQDVFTRNQLKAVDLLQTIYGLSEQEAVYITYLNRNCPIRELLKDLEEGKRSKKANRAEIISFVMSALAKLEE